MEDAEQEEADSENVRGAGSPVRLHGMGDMERKQERKVRQLVDPEESEQVEKPQQEGFPPSSEPPLVGQTPSNGSTGDRSDDPHKGNENGDKNCNACNFCEDVCFSILCARCKIKRKNLYAKYKKYKKHNLRICQKEIKLVLKLNMKARAEILSGSLPDGESRGRREVGEAGKAIDGGEAVDATDAVDPPNARNPPNAAHPAQAEQSNPNGERDEKETPQRRDQYDTLKDAIRRSKSLTYSECEREEKKMKYYNYTKYKQCFTKCEVRRHCDVNDCWVVANGYVYDVTTILGHHPGGINCILKKGGDDVSVDYSFHSKYAQKNFWEPLKIGKIITCSKEVNDLQMGSLSSKMKNKCMMM
ncbi:heme/steroid binding domain containing protein [Plasmodium cynomolgi strain B]|uniref:Heme/steroid binding domain containing protein n=1 Tax=Plasmodium cynomolgi (strain B) TaxID=1120755 RepID=K6UEI8_PLACD|nr:heme/steroid binding domain containing protein [Plasmodium cynomolgi strain B]GAB68426.1 heme/steroid binding domain containing protein [Plasmodium cynomolgi strain B]